MPPINRILPFIRPRPHPIDVKLVKIHTAGGIVSAVSRQWLPGDAERCRLCPECTARADHCLIVFSCDVSRAEAPMISTIGMTEQRPSAWKGSRNG